METPTKPFNLSEDTHLPNGAKILKFRKERAEGGCGDKIIVLCENENSVQPFITWQIDKQGNAFWGHYFHKLESAEADYKTR